MWLTFHHSSTWNFLAVLYRARPFSATDARDKVYALLGHQSARFTGEREALVSADYTKTAEQVFWDVAVATIQETEKLEIISFVYHKTHIDSSKATLPLWVPRWDDKDPLSFSQNVHYSAANGMAAFIEFFANRALLAV
jgi:hypothetical protein